MTYNLNCESDLEGNVVDHPKIHEHGEEKINRKKWEGEA
jgi:hypothetical protein